MRSEVKSRVQSRPGPRGGHTHTDTHTDRGTPTETGAVGTWVEMETLLGRSLAVPASSQASRRNNGDSGRRNNNISETG